MADASLNQGEILRNDTLFKDSGQEKQNSRPE